MANMSYCRFHNTALALSDCEDHFDEIYSKEEKEKAVHLVRICRRIAERFDGMSDEELNNEIVAKEEVEEDDEEEMEEEREKMERNEI
jgi:hypothetical protein